MIKLLLTTILLGCSQFQFIENNKPIEKKEPVAKVETPELKITQTLQINPIQNTKKVIDHCENIDKYFKRYGWSESYCKDIQWEHVRSSYYGNPIFWTVFGNEELHEKAPKNTTLIMCGVHGDEITPVKFCFDIIEDLKKSHHKFEDNLVIVAPLVNPDGFLKEQPTRTNARGVDPNRNLPTKDWYANALKQWKTKYRASKRRYPGKRSNSEQETIFQVNLITRYNPNKVISVHSPLTILDYDGPSIRDTAKDSSASALSATQLLITMSKKAKGYKVSNYPYFPGSLGNWAGNERSIPTYTLELPSSDPAKSEEYWQRFSEAIHHAIKQDFRFDIKKKAAQTR